MAKKTASELLKDIETEEAEEFKAFELKMKQKREKALAAVIDPLRAEANRLRQVVNDANTEINDIEKQLAKLTGKQAPVEGGRKQRAKRKSAADKLAIAQIVYGILKDEKQPKSAGELKNVCDGVAISQLFKIWNAANPKMKITKQGDKAVAKYSV